ncbi:uncharacterized protein LOC143735578 [Siphateles boraxobius]|uniref:uncharacterized protein LOC143735578 n=1 Tax=Siphateles boraxobius TaxID=180520 RepID=UPI004063B66D
MENSILLIFLWLLCGAESDEMTVLPGDIYTDLPLPTPKIIRDYAKSPVTDCMVECSAVNVSHVTLSWYKGNSLQSNVSVSDHIRKIFLHLEVEYHDKNTYSCVINNTISKQTQHLNISQICGPCVVIKQSAMPVKEGDDVTLHPDLEEIDQLFWLFQGKLIAELNNKDIQLYNNERFNGRLKLDIETGNLTITNTKKPHNGYYELQINSVPSKCWVFNVTVHAHLPVPVINRDSSQCSSSSERSSESRCSLVCSVLNVSHVTLSWYKGISVLSSISVCDLSISLSLPLEVEYQDNNTYSCVLNNTISNQTTHLDISRLCLEPDGQSQQPVMISGWVVAAVLIVLLVIACVKIWQYKREIRMEASREA